MTHWKYYALCALCVRIYSIQAKARQGKGTVGNSGTYSWDSNYFMAGHSGLSERSDVIDPHTLPLPAYLPLF